MKKILLSITLLVFFILACNSTLLPVAETAAPAASQSPLPTKEPTQTRPPQEPNATVTPETGNTGFDVTNPTSGAGLFVAVSYPENWDETAKLPSLVFVPGGNDDSGAFTKTTPAGDSTISVTNDAGFVAIIFDPDGRGKSQGTEDYDGFIHQDGLAEVIRYAAALPGVDSAKIGLVTSSYGITMGSGALARYPDLPVKFLIDWEGPANRMDTGGCDSSKVGHLQRKASCTDEAFWAEREASTFISQVRVPYQRIQSVKDHAQPDYAHTVLMVNNAVQGGVPWVRLNDESPNQKYDLNSMPPMLPDRMDLKKNQSVVRYAQELLGQSAASMPVGSATQSANSSAVLLFTIGMHIEPMGKTAQGFEGGVGDYHQQGFFDKHAKDILLVTKIIEKHGGRMTIQTQSPFTQVAIESGNTLFADLAARGHEIALHFHEGQHLGQNSKSLPVQKWCSVMKEELALITQASGVTDFRYWSGGNLYPNLFEAAVCAGLDVNSDWKNPELQETPLELVGVNPWQPAGGTDGQDLTAFLQHDPNGPVIFLPEGQFDRTDFAASRRSENSGGDEAYFAYLKDCLYASLAAADPNKVNVFHFTVHAGEFRGEAKDPFGVIERFLTEAVDPLIASGQVRWATFSEMADAFAAWEQANPGVNPK